MDWALMPRQQAFTLPLFNRPVGLALATPSLLAQIARVESSSVCLHPMFTSWALQEIIPELVLLDVSVDLFLMSKIFGCGRVLSYPDALCPASTANNVDLTLDDEHLAFQYLGYVLGFPFSSGSKDFGRNPPLQVLGNLNLERQHRNMARDTDR